jgi:hypothetical protein
MTSNNGNRIEHDSIGFSRKLVKGRIAETLFEQLLRDAGCFTILAFGYENVLPELANEQRDLKAEDTMEIIRRAPDFVVINNNNHEVYLIEVKYMMNPREDWILRDAKRMYESWKPSYLFLATPNGFFFDKAKDIVEHKGVVAKLNHPQISDELQSKYTQLLNEFIPPEGKAGGSGK